MPNTAKPFVQGLLRMTYLQAVSLASRTPLASAKFLRRVHRKIVPCLRPESVEMHGFTLFLDPTDAMHLCWNNTPSFDLTTLVDMCQPGEIVYDVGAHIGLFALSLARRVGPSGHVYAFEPDPRNHECLVRNIEANKVNNITAIGMAVARHSGNRGFTLEECTALSRLVPANRKASCTVEAISIDDFIRAGGPIPNLVKIDVEGSEPEIVAGMRHLLTKTSDIRLALEFAPHRLDAAGFSSAILLSQLEETGFELLDIHGPTCTVRHTESANLIRDYPASSKTGTNLLCQRGQRL